MWKRFILLATLLIVALPAGAQQQGVIREGTLTPISELSTINPLLCNNLLCYQVTNLLFPSLLYVDPATNTFAPAGDGALVTDWAISEDGQTYTLAVRDDLTWSDGTPITAADVLFTLQAVFDEDLDSVYYTRAYNDLIASASTPDEQTVVVVEFSEPTCRGLHWLDVPVIPAHPFADVDNLPDIRTHPFNIDPVTASAYVLDEIRAPDYVRLRSVDRRGAYELIYMPSLDAQTEAFLEGELNYLGNFYAEKDIPNLLAAGAQVEGGSARAVFLLRFNLADPANPRPWDTENEDGQGVHPVFGDIRVRQAVQLGINVDEIITIAEQGRAIPVDRLALTGAWYTDDTLTRPDYDYQAARQLLNEAGWRDTNGDGILECRACETAPVGTALRIQLADAVGSSGSDRIVFVLREQLQRLGFAVDTTGGSAENQQFDLALDAVPLGVPYDPIRVFGAFTTEQDIPGQGSNIMSYSNPRVDDLLNAAATSGCIDTTQQAQAFQEVEAILAEDVPYVPLFAPDSLYVASDRVLNFQPYPQNPLWNVDEWIITDLRVMP